MKTLNKNEINQISGGQKYFSFLNWYCEYTPDNAEKIEKTDENVIRKSQTLKSLCDNGAEKILYACYLDQSKETLFDLGVHDCYHLQKRYS